MPALRLFVAVELPRFVREALERFQESLCDSLPNVHWVKGGGLHVTLQFLGDTDETLVKEISAALATAGSGRHAPFEAACGGLGVFPNVKRARVVWAGIEKGGRFIEALALDIKKALRPLGFRPERGRFIPHVTLGRIRGGERPDVLESEMDAHRGETFGAFRVESFTLFESHLRPEGAEYAALGRFPLRSGQGFT